MDIDLEYGIEVLEKREREIFQALKVSGHKDRYSRIAQQKLHSCQKAIQILRRIQAIRHNNIEHKPSRRYGTWL